MTTITRDPVVTTTDTRPRSTPIEPTVALKRRTIDTVFVGVGAVLVVVLVVAGGLLTWGANFSKDYVNDELSSQNIAFPPAAALEEEGRTDLLPFAGHAVNTGPEAEAYASFINGHLEGIADGATFADLGDPERAANDRRRDGDRGWRQRHRDRRAAGRGRRHQRSAQHPLQG